MMSAWLGSGGPKDHVLLFNPRGRSISMIQSLVFGCYVSQSILSCQHAEQDNFLINFNYIDPRNQDDVRDSFDFLLSHLSQCYSWLVTNRCTMSEFIGVLNRMSRILNFPMFMAAMDAFNRRHGGQDPVSTVRLSIMGGRILPDLAPSGTTWSRFATRPTAPVTPCWVSNCRRCWPSNYSANEYNQ